MSMALHAYILLLYIERRKMLEFREKEGKLATVLNVFSWI